MGIRIQDTADVSPAATIGDGSSVWHLAQVREDAVLGKNCVVGRGVYVGTGVRMGDNCQLQNYEPAMLEDGVFVGPAVVFTNDHYPRSIDPDGKLKRGDDWEAVGVTVRRGASIGARSVCLAPVTIGRWALVAAGSVVTKDVLDFAAKGLVGAVGHIERHNPALQSARARLAAGELGAVYQVTTRRQGPFPARIADVGVVKDLATHDIDLTVWVTQQPFTSVGARTATKSGREFEDLVAVTGLLAAAR